MIPLLLSCSLVASVPQQVVRTFHDRWVPFPRASPMTVLDDLDGDSWSEILIGEQGEPFGELRILNGSTGEIVERLPVNELYMGYAVDFVGDVTGDGVGDFVGSGYLGNLGHLWDGVTRERLWDGQSFDSAKGIGDIDGDGFGDFVLGSFLVEGWPGSATVYYGGRYQAAYHLAPSGSVSYGKDVIALGDVDGDGIGDFAIGASGLILGEYCFAGEVYIHSGANGRLIHRLEGEGTGSGFGEYLAALGDVTGDGIGDLAVSAMACCASPCWNAGPGRVSFFDGASGKLLEHLPAPGGITWFGNGIEGIGDLDGNGFGDLLVQGRAMNAETGRTFGTIFALDGGSREVIYAFWNEGREQCGYGDITGAGDMNGDGFPDFSMSSFCTTGIVEDRIEVYSGAPIGVRTIGTPCEPLGKPLRIGATGVPLIGTLYEFHLTGVDAGVAACLLIGPRVTSTGNRLRRCPEVLPVETRTVLSKPLRPGEGVASAALKIPNRMELIGTKVYAQWVLHDSKRPARSRILELEIQPTSPYRSR